MPDVIESVTNSTFDRVWRIITEIGTDERHFNDLQARYRRMASGWLLAIFAGIGFVIINSDPPVIPPEIPPQFLITVISLAGCIGVGLLWVLDLLVYHRLLDSLFVEGKLLEARFSWLPPLRHNLMKTQNRRGALSLVVIFYQAQVALLILVAGGALAHWLLVVKSSPYLAVFVIGVSLVIAGVVALFIKFKTENTADIEERLLAAQ
jgi:hypothetical protein